MFISTAAPRMRARQFDTSSVEVHDAVADLLRPPLVPELRPDVAARPPRDVHRRLVDVPALGATPHELPVLVVHDLDLAVEAAPLAVVRLRVQLGIHNVVIDETHKREDGGDVVLEVRNLHVGDRPARREVLRVYSVRLHCHTKLPQSC